MLPAPALPVGCVLVVASAPHSSRQLYTLRMGPANREKVEWCLETRAIHWRTEGAHRYVSKRRHKGSLPAG